MSDWKDEFDRRCRRVMGVTDDTQPVVVETSTNYYGTMTGEETVVLLRIGGDWREFLWMGDLIKELDAVPDAL